MFVISAFTKKLEESDCTSGVRAIIARPRMGVVALMIPNTGHVWEACGDRRYLVMELIPLCTVPNSVRDITDMDEEVHRMAI